VPDPCVGLAKDRPRKLKKVPNTRCRRSGEKDERYQNNHSHGSGRQQVCHGDRRFWTKNEHHVYSFVEAGMHEAAAEVLRKITAPANSKLIIALMEINRWLRFRPGRRYTLLFRRPQRHRDEMIMTTLSVRRALTHFQKTMKVLDPRHKRAGVLGACENISASKAALIGIDMMAGGSR